MPSKEAFISLRWIVIVGTSYLLLAENNYNVSVLSGLFIAFFISSNLVIKRLQERYSQSRYFYPSVALSDILLVTGAIYFFGKPTADFYAVFFFIIMLSALGENIKLGILTAVTASVIYAFYQFKTGSVDLELPMRIVFLLIVAIFNTSIVQNLKKEKQKVSSLVEEKKKMHIAMEEEKEKFGEMLHAVDAVLQIVSGDKSVIWSNRKGDEGAGCYNLREGICVQCVIDDGSLKKEKVVEKNSGANKRYLSVTCSPMQGNNYYSITRDITHLSEMESELKSKSASFSFLRGLTDVVNRSKNGDEAFPEMAALIEKFYGFEIIALRALRGKYLSLLDYRGIEKSMIPAIKNVGLKESVSGAVILKREPVVIRDMDVFYASYAARSKEMGLKCLISVPVYSRGAIFGTLSIGSRTLKNIDKIHSDVFAAAANILGISLSQSRETV